MPATQQDKHPGQSRLFLALAFAVTALLLPLPPLNAATVQFSSGDRQVNLIELFTSQGCSSCPPAERWLGNLKEAPGLWREFVPVAFHVDYWDYIGWRDELARPAYSQRQRRYRTEGGIGAVYTPAFLVNGKEWRRRAGLDGLPRGNGSPGILEVALEGQQLSADYRPADKGNGAWALNIALLGAGMQVDISRGENAGKRLPQDFVVLEYRQFPSADGHWETLLPRHDLPAGTRPALAVWVSHAGTQMPLQATGGWLE